MGMERDELAAIARPKSGSRQEPNAALGWVSPMKGVHAMAKVEKGDRTARLPVRIVESGNRIALFFDVHDLGPITFNAGTGTSGPKAYQKLRKILDAEDAKG
jgi:hypothetical protein